MSQNTKPKTNPDPQKGTIWVKSTVMCRTTAQPVVPTNTWTQTQKEHHKLQDRKGCSSKVLVVCSAVAPLAHIAEKPSQEVCKTTSNVDLPPAKTAGVESKHGALYRAIVDPNLKQRSQSESSNAYSQVASGQNGSGDRMSRYGIFGCEKNWDHSIALPSFQESWPRRCTLTPAKYA